MVNLYKAGPCKINKWLIEGFSQTRREKENIGEPLEEGVIDRFPSRLGFDRIRSRGHKPPGELPRPNGPLALVTHEASWRETYWPNKTSLGVGTSRRQKTDPKCGKSGTHVQNSGPFLLALGSPLASLSSFFLAGEILKLLAVPASIIGITPNFRKNSFVVVELWVRYKSRMRRQWATKESDSDDGAL